MPTGGAADGSAVASVTAATPPTNRSRSTPAISRPGNQSPVARRARSSTGSGTRAAVSTRLPNRRPRQTEASETTQRYGKTAATVAICALAPFSGGPSVRFAT